MVIMLRSFQTLAIQSAKHERSGYATATFFTLFDTGLAIGSYILGLVATQLGYQNLYLFASSILVITLGIFILQIKKTQHPA